MHSIDILMNRAAEILDLTFPTRTHFATQEILSSGFPTRTYLNQPAKLQRLARTVKFHLQKVLIYDSFT